MAQKNWDFLIDDLMQKKGTFDKDPSKRNLRSKPKSQPKQTSPKQNQVTPPKKAKPKIIREAKEPTPKKALKFSNQVGGNSKRAFKEYKDQEENNIFLKIVVAVGLLSSIAYPLFSFINYTSNISVKAKNTFAEEEKHLEKVLEKEEETKQFFLAKNYDELVTDGLLWMEQKEYKLGIENLFYAKTIKPFDIKTRYLLIQASLTVYQDSLKLPEYVYAEREIKNAYKYAETKKDSIRLDKYKKRLGERPKKEEEEE